MNDVFHAAKAENMEGVTVEEGAIAAEGKRAPFILRIPDEVIRFLLEEWLTLDDIVRLDTAMTSQKYRPQLLDFMADITLPFLIRDATECVLFRGGGEQSDYFEKSPHGMMISTKKRSCEELYWLFLRYVYVESFALVELDDEFVESLDFPDLLDLHVFCGSERSIRHLTNMGSSGSSLIRVHLHRITESVGIRLVAEHYPNLKSFTLADPKTTCGVIDDLLFMFGSSTELVNVSLKDVTCTDVECALLGQYGDLMYELIHVRAETESAFGSFIDKCLNLSFLSYFCRPTNGVFDGIVLDRAAKACTQLVELLVDEVTTANITDLSQNCPLLGFLQMYGFADDFAPSCLERLNRNHRLEELLFSDVLLTEEVITAISQLGNIRDLTCYDCEVGAGAGFRLFKEAPISKCLRRFDFHISGEFDINSGRNCIEGLTGCPNLSSFNFKGGPIDDVSLLLLCTSCPQLECICISIGFQRNKLSLDGLSQAILQCKHLKTIYLTQTSVIDGVMSTRSTRVVDEFEEQLKDLRLRFQHVKVTFTRR